MGAALLGPLGGLERVAATAAEPVESEPRVKVTTALTGRVYAQVMPRARRVWTCDENTVTPEDAALLEWLAINLPAVPSGYVWYSSYSQVTNMLTPDEAFFSGATWTGGLTGGSGTTADGTRYFTSRTTTGAGSVELASPMAVPAGSPVSVSAYVSTHPAAEAVLTVTERDAASGLVETHTAVVPPDTFAERASVSFTSDARTASLRVTVSSPLLVALPAVTLTRKPQPWASGRGCRRAAVVVSGESPQMAAETSTNWGRWASRSFTVHELD